MFKHYIKKYDYYTKSIIKAIFTTLKDNIQHISFNSNKNFINI